MQTTKGRLNIICKYTTLQLCRIIGEESIGFSWCILCCSHIDSHLDYSNPHYTNSHIVPMLQITKKKGNSKCTNKIFLFIFTFPLFFFVDGSLDKSFADKKTLESTNNPKSRWNKIKITTSISLSKVSSRIGKMGITKDVATIVEPWSWELQQHQWHNLRLMVVLIILTFKSPLLEVQDMLELDLNQHPIDLGVLKAIKDAMTIYSVAFSSLAGIF